MAAQPEGTRPTAQVIYERVRHDAHDELARSVRELAFSGLFAGFTIGATPIAVALTLTALEGGSDEFVASLIYPVGFVAVILGRAQFFTENTLYPVVASLEDRRCIPGTARLWAIVLAMNLAGGLVFAVLAVQSGAISESVADEFSGLGELAAEKSFWPIFWSAIIAGWLLALVAWLVEASETAVGQFFVIWLLTLPVGLGNFDHSVATAVEVMGATVAGDVGVGEALGWLVPTVLGNVAGGVLIVAVLNYGQVSSEPGGA